MVELKEVMKIGVYEYIKKNSGDLDYIDINSHFMGHPRTTAWVLNELVNEGKVCRVWSGRVWLFEVI